MKKLLVVLSVTLVLLSGAMLLSLHRGSVSVSASEPESGAPAMIMEVTGNKVNQDLIRSAEIDRVIRRSAETVSEIDFAHLAERIQRAQKTEVRQGLIREFQLAAAKADPARRAELYALLERLL